MQSMKRFKVHVVVVIVRYQHHIDRRQVLETDTGSIDAFWASKTERAGAFRPDRIGENVQPRRLNEKGSVADEGNAQILPTTRSLGFARGKGLDSLPARGFLAVEPPFHQIEKTAWRRTAGIEETHTIEMVGRRTGIIGASIGTAGKSPPPARASVPIAARRKKFRRFITKAIRSLIAAFKAHCAV